MKLFLFILFCFTCLNHSLSQDRLDQASYLDKSIDDKPLTEEKIKEFTLFLKRNFKKVEECQTDKCRMETYHRIASIYFVLDAPKDIVAYYLDKCRAASFELSCRMLTKNETQKGKGKGLPKFMEREYFAKDFSKEWWDKFTKECGPFMEIYLTSKTKKDKNEEIVQLPLFAQQLEAIKNEDQKYRIEIQKNGFDEEIMKKQNKIDEKNRILLDSLVEIYGFPTNKKVGKKGVENAWYVLQHSIDCDWNERWIELFIKYNMTGEITEAKLLFTIGRFYNPQNGYCPEDQRKSFVMYLKDKYPEEIAEKYGYKDFY